MLKTPNLLKRLTCFSQFIKCLGGFLGINVPTNVQIQPKYSNCISKCTHVLGAGKQAAQSDPPNSRVSVLLSCCDPTITCWTSQVLHVPPAEEPPVMSSSPILWAGAAAAADSNAKCGAGHHDCFTVIMQSTKAPTGSTSLNVKLIAEELFCCRVKQRWRRSKQFQRQRRLQVTQSGETSTSVDGVWTLCSQRDVFVKIYI